MKVQNTNRIKEKIFSMFQIHMASSNVNLNMTTAINDNTVIPTDIEKLRADAGEVRMKMSKELRESISVEKSMLLLVIQDMLDGILQDFDDDIYSFFMSQFIEESRVFTLSEMQDNPYIKDIDFKNKSLGDFELRYEDSEPFELQIFDIPKRINELFVDIPRICCFCEKYEYPVIFQKSIKCVWMSVSPNEIFTVDKHIKMAKGNVLTLGCGMGYFAYMASLKDDVQSVTIIEREESVIELFETYILPQFSYKDKIKVIKADAIEYVKNMNDGDYDYCFADIWIGVTDIAPYFAIKEVCRRLIKTKMSYWIEEAFALQLSYYVYMEILNEFSKANKVKVPNMKERMTGNEKRIQTYIEKLLENEEISKPEHIDYYLNPDNIIKMIEQTELIF